MCYCICSPVYTVRGDKYGEKYVAHLQAACCLERHVCKMNM